MEQSGIIFDIKRYAVHDGPGIRTTVFLKGCSLSCWWCHNPESRAHAPQDIVRHIRQEGYDHEKVEKVGYRSTVSAVMKEIEKDVIFFDESGGGVTFSGGEVLCQPDFLVELLKRCKAHEIHTCVDTTGYARADQFARVMEHTDMFLYDLKLMDDNDHMKYTGVSNRQIHENLKSVVAARKKLRIRFPVIPGITDSEENMTAIADFVLQLGGPRVDILPYHRIGEDKYRRLGMEYLMHGVETPSPERMQEICELFSSHGLEVKVGG